MVRRMQLMEAEPQARFSIAEVMQWLREGLLRDNKVVPPVLGVLALIIFAWIVAGALIGDPSEQSRRQQVANQANQSSGGVAQTPDIGVDPGVENRDAESFSQFESKNPFGEPSGVSAADAGGSTTGGDQYGGGTTTGDGGAGDTGTGGSTTAGDQYGGGDFIDQTFPNGQGGGTTPVGGGGGGGTGGGAGDDLFDSGGNLRP